MMTGNFLQRIKRLILSMLILCFSSGISFSQKYLSGNINQPSTHVVSIGADRVIVNDVTGFAANDTILLIQMKGVAILTASSYGSFQNKLGEPGMHEFMIILSVNSGTKEIVFRNNFLNTYDPRGNIQIVRTPYYNSAVVSGKLYCSQWDTLKKSGGVLALIVGRTITLNADIDVSGFGFKGGGDAIGDGICRYTNDGLYGLDYYPGSFSNAGFKGEGVANYSEFNQPLGINYMKGQGYNWTGGGGGNGRYSGGGGGSNRGKGGDGGNEDGSLCGANGWNGGFGGVKADYISLLNRIYMGGGGGSSTNSLTGNSSFGGNGGGIVIIVADGLIGNGGNILSDGNPGGTVSGTGGSGGGGAGGSIALSLNSYGSSSLGFSVSGGIGGFNSNNSNGEGGGGGGGLLYIKTDITPNVITNVNGGSSEGHPGDVGDLRTGFKASLNGFLFNSISSSETDNQIDSVCSNMVPPQIIGTIPVGGIRPYAYLWQKSYDQTTWTPIGAPADSITYTPSSSENTTVYYRRIVTDSSPTPLVDISKAVQIVVQPFIKNNIIGTSDTICFAQDPPAFTSKAVLQDGNGHYTFNWEVSPDGAPFQIPTNAHISEGYTPPPALTLTSFYRRTVTSGRCIDSTAIVKITVLDSLQNNKILNSPPDICYGMAFDNLTATTAATTPALSGGDNTYRFKWESNINGTGWGTAPGVSNLADYNPVELPQRIPSNQYLFHRVVYSGSNNVCASTSNAVLLTDFPVITNNTVTAVSPVCSGISPPVLIGSKSPELGGGNTIYTFNWQDSTNIHNWANISGATNADFQPPELIETTRYRRVVNSSACSDFSKSVIIVVHPPVLNNNISLLSGGVTQTICNNQVPSPIQGDPLLSGGINVYTYQWTYSTDNSVFSPVSTGGTLSNYAPPALTTTTYYRRDVISGACASSSNSVTITVLPLITNNAITGNTKVCYSMIPDNITGATLSGGSGIYKYFWQQSYDGSVWNPAAGNNSSSDYQPPSLIAATKYRRNVSSGLNDCCTSISNIFEIGIDPLPVSPINAGPDTSIYSMEKIYHMKAINPALSGESGTWALLDNGTSSIDNTTLYNTVVRNLSVGKNSFLWTVSNGPCSLKDSVNIDLLQDFIPQGFSPNGDAWNNEFVIEGLNTDDQYVDLSIVNGAGTEVFSTSNREGHIWINWDGKNSRGLDLSEGTYYYLLKLTSKANGQVIKKSGFLILKRY